MKIYGHPASTCTRKVLATLAETNTQHDFEMVDIMKGGHKAADYMAHQPFGQVPMLNDSGFEMYESRAMCRYINEKSKGNLVPQDVQGRAQMEQWISVETSNFTPHAMKYVYHYGLNVKQEDAVLEAAQKGIDTALNVMEQRLSKSEYLAGKQFSLADIGYLPYIEYVMHSPLKETFAKYPHVMKWWGRCSERPSWQKAAGRQQA
jgi:glutathione S-transferase